MSGMGVLGIGMSGMGKNRNDDVGNGDVGNGIAGMGNNRNGDVGNRDNGNRFPHLPLSS